MLAAALLGLLPEAVASVGPGRIQGIGASLLAGIALFFILEKLVLWRHCHTEDCEEHGAPAHGHAHGHAPAAARGAPSDSARDQAAGWIVLFGDGVHNASTAC